MGTIVVHPRVHQRHPELSDADVVHAWRHCVRAVPRCDKNPNELIAVGIDGKGRVLEIIAKRSASDILLVYHAMTPPTKKALLELGFMRR